MMNETFKDLLTNETSLLIDKLHKKGFKLENFKLIYGIGEDVGDGEPLYSVYVTPQIEISGFGITGYISWPGDAYSYDDSLDNNEFEDIYFERDISSAYVSSQIEEYFLNEDELQDILTSLEDIAHQINHYNEYWTEMEKQFKIQVFKEYC